MKNALPAVLKPTALAAVLVFGATRGAAANASISDDFTAMSGWLSSQLAQGLAFNAGETFDPPHELKSRRVQPDLSVGIGNMPLNQKKFPQTSALTLNGVDAAGFFPSSVLFPNLSMHLRAGLPGRMDMSVRFDDMTTPSGYRLSPTMTGKGQSNSIGLGLRKHFFGGEGRPMLSLGGHFNHVYGWFNLHTTRDMIIITGPGTSIAINNTVDGQLAWNVSSYGFNAVLSESYRGWTPFVGCGYNYVTGSASAALQMAATTLTTQSQGGGSDHPEQNQARFMGGVEFDRPWMHFFLNGEIKAVGENAGHSWIAMLGAALPFEIGMNLIPKRAERNPEQAAPAVEYGDYGLPVEKSPAKKNIRLPASDKARQGMVIIE
ncbi:MAG: hypothetical protein NTY77_07710 [Elusimicrobia bacterium]|nr:hypothetical protein [Elusimicrobiota bacterium]